MAWIEMKPLSKRLTVARRAVAVEMLEAFGVDRGEVRVALLEQKKRIGAVGSLEDARKLAHALRVVCEGSYEVRVCRGEVAEAALFAIDELAGRPLVALVAVYEKGYRDAPVSLYVRSDDESFHRLQTHRGTAVWEDWGGYDEGDEHYDYVDVGAMWGVTGATIEEVVAFPDPAFSNAARVRIRLRGLGHVDILPSPVDASRPNMPIVHVAPDGITRGV
ncbi:MAG: hypothetical protein AAGE52_26280 [Myxococcota bacterium]